MPKKKKKGRTSTGDSGNNSTSVDQVTPIQPSLLPPTDILSLRLSTPASSSSLFADAKKSLKYSPTVFLHYSDAEQLDVVTSDKVFVLRYAEHDNTTTCPHLTKAAIAKIKIVDDSRPQTPGTPMKIRKTGPRKASQPGSCHLYPSLLADAFSAENTKKQTVASPSTPATPTTTPQTPTSTRPSASKSKFSFAIGGGGDTRLATPSPSKQQTPLSKKMGNHACDVLIVPVDSDIGDILSNALCKTAKSIRLKEHKDVAAFDPIENDDTSDKPLSKLHSFGPLAKRLIIAHTAGEFLSCHTPFAVSMQGQKIKFEVSEASTTDSNTKTKVENDDKLVAGMQQLSLQDNTDALKRLILNSLQHTPNESKPQLSVLYRICHATSIEFADTESEKNQLSSQLDDTDTVSAIRKPLVAGLDSILEKVQSALEVPLLHPEVFRSQDSNVSFLRPPKGILLHGPSGVGKSSLALQVGQNLESTGDFYVERIHCTSVQSQTAFVGQAEHELVKRFEKAQSPRQGKKGCLLILDDIHLICPRRQGTDLGADRLASTLLALLDGIGNEKESSRNPSNIPYPTVILAVTTNPSMLDAALRRPGRLDWEIEVPVPDEPATRAEILRFHLDGLGATTTTFNEDDWLTLARRAKGFTGADLKLAAKEAVRKCGTSVATVDLLQQAIASVKPSAIKAVTVEVPRVPWTSIGGMEDVKTQLREAIELPLTHGAMFQKLGIRPPRGVLLYGPPGCSKTLMARALATEGHMNFLAVKGPELLSKWLGESERALAALFRRARLASPAIIFFDEVDAIASKRGGGGSGGGERLLSQLLTELDGVQRGSGAGGKERVVIVCATNRPDLLDGALMRPGRIDRTIYVGVPDKSSRENILRIGLRGKSCHNDIDFTELVDEKVSGGLSGAELIAACRDAALKAMEEYEDANEKREEKSGGSMLQDPVIRMHHLMNTLSEMERQITPDMLEFYASFQGKSLAKP